MANFYRNFSRSERLNTADALEFVADALAQSISGMAGGSRIRARRADSSNIDLSIGGQTWTLRLQEQAAVQGPSAPKSRTKKVKNTSTAKVEGQGNG